MTNTKFSRAALSCWEPRHSSVPPRSASIISFCHQYDSNKPTSLEGVVTKVEWTNPHVYIYIDVTDAKTQKVSNWDCEMDRRTCSCAPAGSATA